MHLPAVRVDRCTGGSAARRRRDDVRQAAAAAGPGTALFLGCGGLLRRAPRWACLLLRQRHRPRALRRAGSELRWGRDGDLGHRSHARDHTTHRCASAMNPAAYIHCRLKLGNTDDFVKGFQMLFPKDRSRKRTLDAVQ